MYVIPMISIAPLSDCTRHQMIVASSETAVSHNPLKKSCKPENIRNQAKII